MLPHHRLPRSAQRSRLRGGFFLTLLVLWLSAGPVCADYYRYTDAQGSLCFVDDIKKIPESCRTGVTLIRETKPVPPPAEATNPYLSSPSTHVGAPVIAPPSTPTAAPLPSATKTSESGPRTWGWLALCLAAAASLVLLYQLLKTLQSRQLAHVILISITAGLLLFGYKLYVDQTVAGYFTVKNKVLQLMDKANRRTESIDAEAR